MCDITLIYRPPNEVHCLIGWQFCFVSKFEFPNPVIVQCVRATRTLWSQSIDPVCRPKPISRRHHHHHSWRCWRRKFYRNWFCWTHVLWWVHTLRLHCHSMRSHSGHGWFTVRLDRGERQRRDPVPVRMITGNDMECPWIIHPIITYLIPIMKCCNGWRSMRILTHQGLAIVRCCRRKSNMMRMVSDWLNSDSGSDCNFWFRFQAMLYYRMAVYWRNSNWPVIINGTHWDNCSNGSTIYPVAFNRTASVHRKRCSSMPTPVSNGSWPRSRCFV